MSTPPARSTGHRWAPWLVLLAAALVYVPTIGATVSVDVYSATLASWRIAETGVPWLEGLDLVEAVGPGVTQERLFIQPGADGHLVPLRSPGVVLAAVPAYALAGLGGAASSFALWPGGLTAALLTACSMALLFSLARARTTTPVALLATATVGLTTPVWSVSADAMWTHSVTVLALVGVAWAASRERWWLVGTFGAAALWGRPHLALVVAVVGLGVAWSRRRPDVAVKVGLVSGAGLALSSLWTQWMYGSWLPTGGYQASEFVDIAAGRSLTGSLINQLGVWVSPAVGILVWTPLLLVLAPAMARSWTGATDHARWLAAGGVLYTSVQVYLLDFTGGDGFFGYRLGLEALACLLPLALHSLPAMGRAARAVAPSVIAVQLCVFTLGSAYDNLLNVADHPWRDNTFARAAGQVPALWAFLAVAAVLGLVARRHWPTEWAVPGAPGRAAQAARTPRQSEPDPVLR